MELVIDELSKDDMAMLVEIGGVLYREADADVKSQ